MDETPGEYEVSAVSQLLQEWRGGDPTARDRLVSLLYKELRRMASHMVRQEAGSHSLAATDLVNELYIRLLAGRPLAWQDRAHFMAVAAQQMRWLLVDRARRRLAEKRGGDRLKVSVSNVPGWDGAIEHDVLALNDALEKLGEIDPRAAQVVEARFFGGLEEKEAAEALGISVATLKRDWTFARAWLFQQLNSA